MMHSTTTMVLLLAKLETCHNSSCIYCHCEIDRRKEMRLIVLERKHHLQLITTTIYSLAIRCTLHYLPEFESVFIFVLRTRNIPIF